MNKTIIYITDNALDEEIASICKKHIIKAVGDNPIISVSQKPLDLGKNICVGEIGRNWLNIYKQQLVGLKEAKTDFIAIAEHDVIYSGEHFNFNPPDKENFYYNENNCFLQWKGNKPELEGMFSIWPKERLALSQLICSRELLIDSIEDRLMFIEQGIRSLKKLGEPGAFNEDAVRAAEIAISGEPTWLHKIFDRHLKIFKHKTFKTIIPNLDIRHSQNFTGTRRGNKRVFTHPYWGTLKDIIEK